MRRTSPAAQTLDRALEREPAGRLSTQKKPRSSERVSAVDLAGAGQAGDDHRRVTRSAQPGHSSRLGGRRRVIARRRLGRRGRRLQDRGGGCRRRIGAAAASAAGGSTADSSWRARLEQRALEVAEELARGVVARRS